MTSDLHNRDADTSRGLYEKFIVSRKDGKSLPGEKHAGCSYFVLDLTHDRFAWAALDAYAKACATEYPLLAEDLRKNRVMGALRPIKAHLPGEDDLRR